MDYRVHGILQTRILERVAFPFSRRSFQPRDQTPGLPNCKQILYQLSHKGNPRILEWAAYPFSRGSSLPRKWTGISCGSLCHGKLWETVKDMEAWHVAVHGVAKSRTWLSDWTMPWLQSGHCVVNFFHLVGVSVSTWIAHRIWLRILSTTLEKELKVFDFA